MAVAVVAGLASTAGAYGTAVALSATFSLAWAGTAFAIGAGLSMISQALQPSLRVGQDTGLSTSVANPIAERPIIYGRTRTGGTIVYFTTSGADNKYLHLVIAVAGHAIDGYEKVYFDDEVIWEDGSYVDNWVQNAQINFYDGTQTTADQDLINASNEWNSNCILNDTAYIHVRLEYDPEVYTNGIPSITTTIRGKQVYDPRTDVTEWSENPALCIYDYLKDPKYGLNDDTVNVEQVKASANVCDQLVTIDTGVDQTRYALSGFISTGDTIKANLEKMLSSMFGKLVCSGGELFVNAGYYTSPVLDINESLLVGAVSLQTKTSRRNVYNAVKGTFLSEEENYIFADYPSIKSDTYSTEDGEPLYLDLPLPCTTNNVRAQRLAKLSLNKSRQQRSLSIPVNLAGLKVRAGDVIRFTSERLGISNAEYEVIDFEFEYSDQLIVNLVCVETGASLYDWDAEDRLDFSASSDITLYDGSATAPTGLTATAVTTLMDDGSVSTYINVSWTNPDDIYFDYIVLKCGDQSIVTKDQQYRINNVDQNTEYTINVTAFNTFGRQSTSITDTVTTTSDTTAPANITNGSVASGLKQLTLSWTNPSDDDFDLVKIKVSTDENEPANPFASTRSDTFIHDVNEYNSTRYYWGAPVDRSGNIGNYTLIGTNTTESITIDDVPKVAGVFYLTIPDSNDEPTNAEFLSRVGRNPINNDVVVVNKEFSFSYNGTAWTAVTQFIDGSLLVSESVTTTELDTSSISVTDFDYTGSLDADKTQSAVESTLTITSGGISMSEGGEVKGGQTAYNTGTGFFLGYDTDAYKFSIGDPDGDYLTFDGTNLSITGSLDANTGTIGGLSIGSDKIYLGTGTFNSSDTAFYVDNTGQFSLKDKLHFDGTDLVISGDISADNLSFTSENAIPDAINNARTSSIVHSGSIGAGAQGWTSFRMPAYNNTAGQDYYVFNVYAYEDLTTAGKFAHYIVYANVRNSAGVGYADNEISVEVVPINNINTDLEFSLERGVVVGSIPEHRVWIKLDQEYSAIVIVDEPLFTDQFERTYSNEFTTTEVEPTGTLESITVNSGYFTTGDTFTGVVKSSVNMITTSGNGTFDVSKTLLGNVHFVNGAGANGSPLQAGITWQGSSATEAQAGIYVVNDNSSGTHMALATTNSYSDGPQIGLSITNYGVVDFPRSRPTYGGDGLWSSGDFSSTQITNWDTAHGWGDHSTQGYLTSLPSHNHNDLYYTETEIDSFINRGYVYSESDTDLAVGWYTIATNTGDRASARFGIWDTKSGRHQSVTFYATHHYGTDTSNTLTVLDNSYFSGNPFRYIRIKEASTYDGAVLQVYIDDAGNAVNTAILGDNFQTNGWVLCDWIPDATTPPNVDNYTAFTEASRVDLNTIAQGGFATTGEIYAGGDTTQYRVFHDAYHPNADKWTTARTLSLTGDVTGSVSIDGSANASISAVVANDSHTHDTRYIQNLDLFELVSSSNMSISKDGTQFSKISGGGAWDGEIRSTRGFTGGARVAFSPNQNTKYFMLGLNSDPTANSSYASLDYAFYCEGDGNLAIYESGSRIVTVGTHSAGDVLEITYDDERVTYLQNGVRVRVATVTAGETLYLDSSFNSTGTDMCKLIKYESYSLKPSTIDANTYKQGGLTIIDNARNIENIFNISAFDINLEGTNPLISFADTSLSPTDISTIKTIQGRFLVMGDTTTELYAGGTQTLVADDGDVSIPNGEISISGMIKAGSGTNNSQSTVARFGGASQAGEVNALSLVNSVSPELGNAVSINFHNANVYSPTGKIVTVQRGATVTDSSVEIYGYNGSLKKQVEIDYLGNLDLARGGYQVNGTTVIDSSRNLTNIGSISGTSIYLTNDATIGNRLYVGSDNDLIRVGAGGGGKSGVFGNRSTNNGSSLSYGAYFAYDAYWNGSAWQANRTTLTRKWMTHIGGYHDDNFHINRYAGDASGTWTDGDWTRLLTLSSGGLLNTRSGYQVNGTIVVDSSRNATFNSATISGGNLNIRTQNESNATDVIYLGVNNGNSTGTSNTVGTGLIFAPQYSGYTKRSAGIMQIGEGNYFRSGLAFYTNNTSNATTDWSERMRLDMDGNLVIGQGSVSYTINDNTPVVGSSTNNILHVNGSIQLTNNDDAIVFGRGTSTFLKDEELGFGWGGGLYMTDGTWLRTRGNKGFYNGTGTIRTDGAFDVGGTTVIDSNRYVTTPRLYVGDGNDGYFYSDTNGRTAFAGGDLYIQQSCNTYYNYANVQYHGNSSGDEHRFRSNVLNGTNWSIDTSGNFSSVSSNATVSYKMGGVVVIDVTRSLQNINQIDMDGQLTIKTYANPTINLVDGDGGTERQGSQIQHTGNSHKTYSYDWNNQLSTYNPGQYLWYTDHPDDSPSYSMYLASNGSLTIAGSLTQNSDVSLKENITPITSAMDMIQPINGVRYNKIGHSETEIGIIAQDVEKTMPELVTEYDGIKSVKYANMVAVLIEAVKELKQEIEELKNGNHTN